MEPSGSLLWKPWPVQLEDLHVENGDFLQQTVKLPADIAQPEELFTPGEKWMALIFEMRHLQTTWGMGCFAPSTGSRHTWLKTTCYPLGQFKLSTSSTAQGGGGSFKHKKPIGEVGCCESGMAERSH